MLIICTQICGSGLARESVLTVNEDADCIGLFAGKPAPTGIALSLSYCPP